MIPSFLRIDGGRIFPPTHAHPLGTSLHHFPREADDPGGILILELRDAGYITEDPTPNVDLCLRLGDHHQMGDCTIGSLAKVIGYVAYLQYVQIPGGGAV